MDTQPSEARPPRGAGPTSSRSSLADLARLGRSTATVLLLLFMFLLGIHGLGEGFKLLGGDLLASFFSATSNPFVALTVGILATTLVQSSSVTTAMIVGLCAAPENPLPLLNAVPMIMGANIGTTVTNSMVALAHLSRPTEFRRAFATATCHDFFNFMSVVVLLPLEMATGFLGRLAVFAASHLGGLGGVSYKSPLKGALKAGFAPLQAAAGWLLQAGLGRAILVLLVSAVIIVVSLLLLVSVMRRAMHTRVESVLTKVLGRNPLVSMVVGMVVTVMVQSSSITTSLLVPLAGAGLTTLRQAFPITLGANVGTTITALLASMAVSGPNAHAGLEIALVHFFFNIIGILLIYPVERIRRLPLIAAHSLARLAVRSRRWALIYVVGLFYGLPAICILLSKLLG